jgi:hypothetical protein
MEYFDAVANRKYVPHCIEPSIGVDRLFLALLTSAYRYDIYWHICIHIYIFIYKHIRIRILLLWFLVLYVCKFQVLINPYPHSHFQQGGRSGWRETCGPQLLTLHHTYLFYWSTCSYIHIRALLLLPLIATCIHSISINPYPHNHF